MIISFDEFLTEVLPDVNGCPDPSAINAVRNAAIEFCTRGNVWKVEMEIFQTESGVIAYDLDSPVNGARIIQVMAAFLDGMEIKPRTEDSLDAGMPGWRTIAGKPTFFFQPTPELISLASVPDGTYTVSGIVALCPTRKAGGIERFIYEQYLDVIASGAKARLMMMPGVPWSNPELAAFHDAQFNTGVAAGNVEAARGFSRAPIRTTSYS